MPRYRRSPGDNPVDNTWPAVPLVLYDADCGFCTASVRAAQGRWVGARIDATVATVLRASRGPWPVVGQLLRLPGVRRVAGWGYAVVARNRHRLPGATAACEVPDR